MKKKFLLRRISFLSSAMFVMGANAIVNTANADGLVVIRAKSTLASGLGAKMQVYANGKLIYTKDVNHTNIQDINVESASLVPGAKLDVFFGNDAFINGQDRNLIVESIVFNSKEIKPTEAKYDRGDSYNLATDGKDVINGQAGMWWNGALRFVLPGAVVPPPSGKTGVPGKNEFANNKVSGPIVAKSGQVIENLKISNPNGACITIPAGVTNVRVRNNEIGPCGKYTGVAQDHVGVYVSGSDVFIERNVIHDMESAVYSYTGRHPIVIDRNLVYNIRGPMPRGQMVQFNNVRGGFGQSKVTCNVSDKSLDTIKGFHEDHINMHNTYGLNANLPIEIAYNKIRGGDPNRDEPNVAAGSGTMIGDYGGQYINIHHNLYVLPENVGVGVAGGGDYKIYNNIVWGIGPVRDTMTSLSFNIQDFSKTDGGPPVSGHVYWNNNRAIMRGWNYGGVGDINMNGSFLSARVNPSLLHVAKDNNFLDFSLHPKLKSLMRADNNFNSDVATVNTLWQMSEDVWNNPEFNAPINAACSSTAVTPPRK